MGTIASRDALRIIELTETVLAIVQLAVCQAADLRSMEDCHRRTRELHQAVRAAVPMNTADRRQDVDIYRVLDLHRSGKLPIGLVDFPAD